MGSLRSLQTAGILERKSSQEGSIESRVRWQGSNDGINWIDLDDSSPPKDWKKYWRVRRKIDWEA